MLEARATGRWIRDKLQAAAPSMQAWRDAVPPNVQLPAFRYGPNRFRDIRYGFADRAWSEDVWFVEVLTENQDDIGTWGSLIDATLDKQVNQAAPYGCIIVSSVRDGQLYYPEIYANAPTVYHAGGLFKIRTAGPGA
jgi:hypothetical protein